MLQWQADGGDQISAAADWLGEQNIGSLLLAEGLGCLKQGVEPAAEAAAGNFFNGEVVGPSERGVDESASLIVGDEANPQVAVGQPLAQPQEQRRLAGPEKAAGHDQPGAAGRGNVGRFV